MICENCKQRPATVVVTQITNGEHVNHRYCEVCAHTMSSFQLDVANQDPLSIHQLLQNWFNIPTNAPTQKREDASPKCTTCGWTFRQFLSKGKFGCGHCYESFHSQLPEVFKKLHNGNVKHVGKTPGAYEAMFLLKKQIEELRTKMKAAVEQENFEQAAEIRDEVKQLEAQLANGGTSN